MDWYASEFSVGAFAEFAPGQSGNLMPEMLSPAGKGGRVHFAGDTLSIGHAWIVGGLNSGFRAVQDIVVKGLGRTNMGIKLRREWGPLVSLHSLNSLLDLTSSLSFTIDVLERHRSSLSSLLSEVHQHYPTFYFSNRGFDLLADRRLPLNRLMWMWVKTVLWSYNPSLKSTIHLPSQQHRRIRSAAKDSSKPMESLHLVIVKSQSPVQLSDIEI